MAGSKSLEQLRELLTRLLNAPKHIVAASVASLLGQSGVLAQLQESLSVKNASDDSSLLRLLLSAYRRASELCDKTSAAIHRLNTLPLVESFSNVLPVGVVPLMGGSVLIWIVSLVLRDVSIVDSFWSLGFLLLALIYRQAPEAIRGFVGRKNLVLFLTATWAVRLSAYLTWRNHGMPEDYRYRAMRKSFGPSFWWISLFQTFFLQAALCYIISQPLRAAQSEDGPKQFTLNDAVGTLLWIVGFFFETVGDLQLAQFKANPANKGKVLNTGLWRYTRHPNYFGNATMFWGLWLIATSVPKVGAVSVYSPLLMNLLLLKVSGVSLLERSLKKRKPEYATYVKNTSAFLPWMPKST